MAERDRTPRLDREVPEMHRAQGGDGASNMIFLAARDAARRDQKIVVLGGARNRRTDRLGTIRKYPEIGDGAAQPFQHRHERIAIDIENTSGFKRRAGIPQLVADGNEIGRAPWRVSVVQYG